MKESKLWVADNSGAVKLKCIHLYTPQTVQLGNLTKNTLRGFDSKKKLSKKKKYFGLIIAERQISRRKNGVFLKAYENRVLVMSDREKLLGSRMSGPISKEVQSKISYARYKKLAAISDGVI